MKLFDARDLRHKIPPFLESDIHNKIIISITSDRITKNISYAIEYKYNDNIVRFRGARIEDFDHVMIWGDFYNTGRTLLDLITKEYKAIHEANMAVYYIIIESKKDLEDFISKWKLTNTELGKELTDYWNKNHDMVIQKEALL